MRELLREYFCFSRGEKNGTLLLALIMVLVFTLPYIYDLIVTPSPCLPDREFMEQARAIYGHGGRNAGQEKNGFDRWEVDSRDVNAGGWLSPLHDEAGNLSGNKDRPGPVTGGITFPDTDGRGLPEGADRTELNSADTADLMRVRGLGPVLARRIIRYRDILGGYVHVNQLAEVYGIDSLRLIQIEPFLYADSLLVRRLRPGLDEFGSLLRHPYLSYEQVSLIFRLRREGLSSIDDLAGSDSFTPSEIARLTPYLLFE